MFKMKYKSAPRTGEKAFMRTSIWNHDGKLPRPNVVEIDLFRWPLLVYHEKRRWQLWQGPLLPPSVVVKFLKKIIKYLFTNRSPVVNYKIKKKNFGVWHCLGDAREEAEWWLGQRPGMLGVEGGGGQALMGGDGRG